MVFAVFFALLCLFMHESAGFYSGHVQKKAHCSNAVGPIFLIKKKKGGKQKGPKSKPTIIQIEDYYSDSWKLEGVARILKDGGVGVIPTDTCYSFVTTISNADGVKRLMKLKGMVGKKPLSILCKDISMASTYTESIERKWVFKMLKTTLPGPYTYIMPSSKMVPKQVISGKTHQTRWRRKEIGVRIPDEPIVAGLFDDVFGLDEPLLCGSVPGMAEDLKDIDLRLARLEGEVDDDGEITQVAADMEEMEEVLDAIYMEYLSGEVSISSPTWPWMHGVDVVVDAGLRGGEDDAANSNIDVAMNRIEGSKIPGNGLSTIVDITGDQPILLRQGLGEFVES
mmetsp:Transcript_30188/g.50494  ORF Transcript_30188/g.50494 Transcript_30188/m.50494 type:complete len:339 (+) Transcript_30188:48-1064(+)